MVPANTPHAFVTLGKEKSHILAIFDPPGQMETFFVDLAAVLNEQERPDQKKLADAYTKNNVNLCQKDDC
jgi:hypothetical protein